MQIIKSAKKRMRQQDAKRKYNVAIKSTVKKATRVVKDEVAAGKTTATSLSAAVSQIDRAVKKGVLHKRTAARKKSRLSQQYNAVASKPYGTEKPAKPTTTKKPVAKKAAPKKAAKK